LLQCLFMFEKKVGKGIDMFSFAFITVLFTLYFMMLPDDAYVVSSVSIKVKTIITLLVGMLIQAMNFYNHEISIKLFDDVKNYSDEISRQSKEKETFFACMSHEIRNPIQSLTGAIELLMPTIEKNRENKRLAKIAKSGCEMVLNLISNILDISKIHANKMELFLSPSSLKETVLKVIRLTKQKAEGKNLYLRFVDCPMLPPALEIDARKLSQVVLNLVSNSVKFTQSGGITVQLWWEWSEEQVNAENEGVPDDEPIPKDLMKAYSPSIYASKGVSINTEFCLDEYRAMTPKAFPTQAEGTMGTVMIRIIDTGIGIKEANIGKLFHAFNQADASISGYFGRYIVVDNMEARG